MKLVGQVEQTGQSPCGFNRSKVSTAHLRYKAKAELVGSDLGCSRPDPGSSRRSGGPSASPQKMLETWNSQRKSAASSLKPSAELPRSCWPGSDGPGGLAAVGLAGVPGLQPLQGELGLLADAGPAQHGVERPAVDRHVLRRFGVRMGELHELHRC